MAISGGLSRLTDLTGLGIGNLVVEPMVVEPLISLIWVVIDDHFRSCKQ